MLPRWFRAVLVAELLAVVALAVLGVHLVGQGLHAAGTALNWVRPSQHAPAAPPPRFPAVDATAPGQPVPPQPLVSRAPWVLDAAVLSPRLMARLNRDTGATAVGEYTLLLQLELLARDEVTRLLATVHVAPAPAEPGS
ncbi:MAG TPA: hypothetical protein VGQ42_05835 [Candidatus Dormibacteraeota bacterium]|jgi:hypothetical protein|nr:hypothetical protein [Candidatus Dormibacteraeota bacterium]